MHPTDPADEVTLESPSTDEPLDRRPSRVGPYDLLLVMGQGGAGTVYRARGPDGTEVALKLLDARLLDASMQSRFAREASIRIDHPNIVQVRDAGNDGDGRPYLALELLEGETVASRLRRGALSPAETRDLGVQVCRGLEAAHSVGVIHRDLKPDNLFFCTDGTVKIVDFGIALLSVEDERLTRTGFVMGTPSYLSPEQAQGMRAIDTRSDLWALGAVLYKCLVGRAPFKRETSVATMMAIVTEKLTPLLEKRVDLPGGFCEVIEKCLVKDLDGRWQSAEGLRTALEIADVSVSSRAVPVTVSLPVGEQRVVAVLLAEGVQDLTRAQTDVERHGGKFVGLIGQRAVGLFGSRLWSGDELERAAIAAMAVREQAHAASVSLGHLSEVGGALSGDAMRRAEAACAIGATGVVVDSKVARLLKKSFELDVVREGLVRITGRRRRSSMVPAPTVEMPAVRLGDQSHASSTSSPLLGRAVEIAQLRRALDTVLGEERSVIALVVGPAGIGKSRLYRALLDMLGEPGSSVRVLQARAEPIGMGNALSPVADAMRRRLRMGTAQESWPSIDSTALDERQRAIRQLAEEAFADETLRIESAPFLGELLGVEMGIDPALTAARKDAQTMADRLRMAVLDYLSALTDRGAVALCVEDLHWADGATLKLIEELLERHSHRPLFVFGTARPELDQDWPEYCRAFEMVRIAPSALLPNDVVALAQATAGRSIGAALAKKITERTGGNPFFVEQVVLELVERQGLDDPPDLLPLPLTVEAAVQSRLDHLPLSEKTACKRAAILGRPFSIEELRGLGVPDARTALEVLVERNIVSARAISQVGKGRGYRFTHALLGEVAYNMIAADARRDLHRRAASVLSGTTDHDDEEVATHHERGGEPDRAGRCFASAAVVANRMGDGDKTLRCSEKALALGAPEESRFELHMARSETLQFLGRYEEQGKDLDAAWTVATDDKERARVWIDRSTQAWWTGRHAESGAAAEEAAKIADGANDPVYLVQALQKRAFGLMYGGEHEAARHILKRAKALLDRCDFTTIGLIENASGVLAALTGEHTEVFRCMTAAVENFTKAGNLRRAAQNEINIGDCLNRVGAYVEAERTLRRALETAKRVGNKRAVSSAVNDLAYTLTALGRPTEAMALLEQDVFRGKQNEATRSHNRAEALLALEQPERAREEAQRSAEAFAAIGSKSNEAQSLVLLARARLALGDIEGAEEASRRALMLRDELGSIEVDEAVIFLVRARVLELHEKNDEARTILERGRVRVFELAAKITDPDWRERFLAIAVHQQLVGPP